MDQPNPLVMEFDQEMADTRRTLERVPEDQFDWKPHEKSFSARELAWHIAQMPTWAFFTMTTDELDYMAMPQPEPPESLQEILDMFDGRLDAARKAIADATPEDMATPWTLRGGEEVMFSMPRGAVMRSMIMNHTIHHRGQLTVYLRELGAPVPALYGPSADEEQ